MKAAELKAVQAPLKEKYRTLLCLTERYCVVYQTLCHSPELTLSYQVAA